MKYARTFIVLLTLAAIFSPAGAVRAQDDAGGTIAAQAPMFVQPSEGQEVFVPDPQVRPYIAARLELRPDATIPDGDVKVKNVCRWQDSDAAFLAPVAELSITHMTDNQVYARISLDQLRATLRDAGMNLALVRIGGATLCLVNRSGPLGRDRVALDGWADAHQAGQAVQAGATETPPPPQRSPGAPGDGDNLAGAPRMAAPAATGPGNSLRNVLATDLARHLELDPASIEMSFNASDDKVLNLAGPYFQFEIAPRRDRLLTDLCWDVGIVAGGERHSATINATARVWETQIVLVKPLAYRQVIRDQDVEEKRMLAEQLPPEPLLSKAQAVGQEAARELKPGVVLTSSLVSPAMLARPGQLITVNVIRGRMKITAVAKAIDGGSYGQAVRARNDIDPTQVFEVTLTGPQEGTIVGEQNSIEENRPTPIAAAAN